MTALPAKKDVANEPKPQIFDQVKYDSVPFEIPTRYKTQAMIGRGAYGQVVSAKHVSSGKYYAIKKLENIFRHPVHAKRALREVKILKQLKHDGIVEITDLYLNDQLEDLYITMPLMDTDLAKVIRSSQKLLDKHIQFFVYQILRSLLYMQSAGVIHRDLKPSNIFVDLNCDIKVGDLGMAKVIDYNPNAFVPMTEYVATRWYRAPEIMMWKAYGFEVDIWSVGCIMAELIARKPLFPGQDLQDQLRKIFSVLGTPKDDFISQIPNERVIKWVQSQTHYDPLSLDKVLPKASASAIDLLSKMLEYSPYKRISVSLALQHPYFEDFHDPKTESVMQDRVKFPHDIEQFDVPKLKSSIIEEAKYYAQKNNYIATTEIKPSRPSAGSLMPSIGSLNNGSLKPSQSVTQQQALQNQQPMNISAGQQMVMMNGTPCILTPVMFQPISAYNPQFLVDNQMNGTAPNGQRLSNSDTTPWVIGKRKSDSKSEAGDDQKMEID